MKHDTFRESLVVVVTWRKRPFGSKLVGRNICSYGTMSMLEDDTWPNSKNNSIQPSWHQEFSNTNRVLWGRVDSVRLYYRTRDKGGLLTPLVHFHTVISTCSEIAIAGLPSFHNSIPNDSPSWATTPRPPSPTRIHKISFTNVGVYPIRDPPSPKTNPTTLKVDKLHWDPWDTTQQLVARWYSCGSPKKPSTPTSNVSTIELTLVFVWRWNRPTNVTWAFSVYILH